MAMFDRPACAGADRCVSSTMLAAGAMLTSLLLAAGSTNAQERPSSAPLVEVEQITPQDLSLATELPGRVSAYNVAQVRPQVGGILEKRLFEEGSYVIEGQALYQINDSSYQAALASAKAALAKATANLDALRITEKRLKELARIKAASQQDHDTARAQLQVAVAEQAAAQASLELAQINLDHTRIVAPLAGRVGSSNLTQGALLSPNQAEALATIQQLDTVYVDIIQSSTQLLQLKKAHQSGDLKRDASATVTLKLEDGSLYPHEGTVKFSDAKVDPSTGTVTLRAAFPNPDELLLPGMYVRAQVSEGVRENALLVPQRAVTRNAQGKGVVLVLSATGEVEQRTIDATRTVFNDWLVEGGLEPEANVIVSGTQKVRPGATAQAVGPATASAAR